MALNIYNTLTRQKEALKPLREGVMGIYVCGPTVYDHPHIGHAKSYVSFDVVVRYLRHLGYKVRYVQNITDVGHLTDNADQGEDKIIKRARIEQVEPMELVERYMHSYFEDMDALNVLRPDISPRASGHIPEQIELVNTLINKGYAYEVNGNVYFDISRFKGYGKLSGKRLDELEAGARVEVNQEKRQPFDFALWKRAERGHIMRWKSPWGEGFPGWHLECSVMSMKYLGNTFDIHGGGLENVFPHHECEIAQSESANEQEFVRYWMHNNMVTVNGQKMGKSLGNFVTLKEAYKRYSPLVVRLFVLSTHYRSPMDYSDEALVSAGKGTERLHNTVRCVAERLRQVKAEATEIEADFRFSSGKNLDDYRRSFFEAMDDDFNTAGAIGVIFELSKDVNIILSSNVKISYGVLKKIDLLFTELGDKILGILPKKSSIINMDSEKDINALISLLIDTRQGLRTVKNWRLADEIRKKLDDLGFILEDSPDGTIWKRKGI